MKMIILASLVSALGSSFAEPVVPRLVVLGIEPGGGVPAEVARAMTDAVTTEVSRRGYFAPMSANDIQTLLGIERQKQLAGCSEEGSCLAELAGAVGAQYVMSGTLTKLGSAFQLTLQTLDSAKAQPLGRATRIADDLKLLQSLIPSAVADATATPQPAPPSRLLPFSLMGIGGAAAVLSGVAGFQALAQEGALSRELETGAENPAALRPRSAYEREKTIIERQRTFAAIGLGIGAALVAAGVVLNPSDSSAGARTAVVFTGGGAALVGSF